METAKKLQAISNASMQRSLGATLLIILYVYGLVIAKGSK